MDEHPSLGLRATSPSDFFADPGDLEHFNPHLVLGYFHRLELILKECPVEIYAASSLKHPWPYRLQKAGDCAQASFWRSQHRILDSNIMDPTLTNEEILAEAIEKEAHQGVVAKDYLPFEMYDRGKYDLREITGADDHWEATKESIREFISLHDPDDHPPAYIPLQPPYADSITEIRPFVQESHLEERYMLGGLKDAKPAERLNQAEEIREIIGDEPILHGLGWGPSDTLVKGLREQPGLIDSIDNSGPSQAIMNNNILDDHWVQRDFGLVEGDFRNSIAGVFEFGMLMQAAHRFTPYNMDFEGIAEQRQLSEY